MWYCVIIRPTYVPILNFMEVLMKKIVVTRKQRNLLVNSEVTEKYPWFLEILKNQNKITSNEIPDERKSDFQNVVPFIIKHSGDEWKYNEDVKVPYEDMGVDERNHKRCSLCNTRNRHIFYIKNKLNGISLNVGSECIKGFADFDKLGFGMTPVQMRKKASRIYRMSVANSHITGIDTIIENWEYKVDTYSPIIPNGIRDTYLKLGKEARREYDSFLNSDTRPIDRLESIYKNYLELEETMSIYQETNKDNPFAVSKSILSWLESSQKHSTIDSLRETGFISQATICDIHEKGFIKKIEHKIIVKLEELELEVDKFDYEENEIKMTLNMYNGSVKIACSFKRFMEFFGALIANGKPKIAFAMSNLLRISEVKDKSTKEFVVAFIDDRFSYFEKNIRFRLPEDFNEENEVDIINKLTGEVFVYKLSSFLKEMIQYVIYHDEDMLTIEEDRLINLKGKWYALEELTDLRDVSAEMSNKFYRSIDKRMSNLNSRQKTT